MRVVFGTSIRCRFAGGFEEGCGRKNDSMDPAPVYREVSGVEGQGAGDLPAWDTTIRAPRTFSSRSPMNLTTVTSIPASNRVPSIQDGGRVEFPT
jgi:hypothetical protein